MPDDWLTPEIIVTGQVKCSLTIREPDRDLIPEELFTLMTNGLKFSDINIPLASFRRSNGETLTGVLVYAENWNPPLGCFRVSGSEERGRYVTSTP